MNKTPFLQNVPDEIVTDSIEYLPIDTFQSLFNTMPAGVVYGKLIHEEHGDDFRIIYANSFYKSLTGLDDVENKLVSELAPGIRSSDPELFEILRRVSSSRKAEKTELYVKGLKRWLSITINSPIKGHFIAIIDGIDDRKKHEDALLCKTALLDAHLDCSIEGILIVDKDGKKILQNQRTIDLWKIPQNIADDPDDRNQVAHVMYMTKYPEKFVEQVTYLYSHPDEKSCDELELIDGTVLDRYSSPVLGKDGHYYGRIWAFRDITERKRNEEALRQKTALLEALLNSTIEGIMVTDGMGNKIIENQRISELWKIPEHLLGNKNLPARAEYINSMIKDPAAFKKRIGFLMKNAKEESRDELELIDGIVLDRYSAPVVGVDGHYYGRIWTYRDITDRKLVEASIAAEKELLSVTLRSIGEGVITTDIQGNIVIMNNVAEELTGWQQQDAQGMSLSSVFTIVNENNRNRCENPFKKVISTGQIVELPNNTILISRDGSERVIANCGAPIKNTNSETIGVVLVFRDITEKQRMLDKLQRIDKLDSLGVLAGGIAHDFNNLLCVIFGFMEMARKASSDNKKVSGYLDNALVAFNRAKDLTKQLLTFSKGGAPKRKAGDIGKLIKGNSAFVLSGSNVSCEIEIASDLWLCDFDENQMAQVIDNIIINAIEAMPLGGKIKMTAKNFKIQDPHAFPSLRGDNFVKISIEDTGVGIPLEIIKRIFDPFFTTKHKGNGLGLATCYSIIQKHEGYIDVESITGKGSAFHIYLPANKKVGIQNGAVVSFEHKGSGKILLMDDENLVREIASTMLGEMGYTIIEAKDGEEALALFRDASKSGETFRCAFFDLTIPGGMGGKEAIVKLREFAPDMPVFAASGFSEDPVIACPNQFGFTDGICKPFMSDDLAEMLNKHFKT
ncbi:MAG TPA: ATP-binding protein [Chitinispirillaceae bacterium]|nr:ATP-binding protein [Chitinispirillaceae bacterium]